MFNKPEIEKRKAILTIGDTEYCSINIKGSRTLTNTCIRLQDCMNKIAQWERPNLQLFFSSGDGVCGLVTAEDMLFVVYMENEEQNKEARWNDIWTVGERRSGGTVIYFSETTNSKRKKRPGFLGRQHARFKQFVS